MVNKIIAFFFSVFLLAACQKNFDTEISQIKTFLEKEQYTEAIKEADKILKTNELAEVYNLRGVALLSTNQDEKAIIDFNKAIKLGGENLSYKYFYNRGNAYLKTGKPEDAWQDYEKAAELDTTIFEIYWNKANALVQLNRHSEAITDFGKAIEKKPQNAAILLQRGVSLLALKQYALAQADFAKVQTLKPDLARAYYLWALAEMNLSDQKTTEYLQKAQSLGSTEAENLLTARQKK